MSVRRAAASNGTAHRPEDGKLEHAGVVHGAHDDCAKSICGECVLTGLIFIMLMVRMVW